MDNNFDDDDNNIRQPDPVKIDRLIDDDTINPIVQNNINNNINNTNFDTILELSKNEYNSLQEQEEQKAIEFICNQTKQERQNKFNNIKTQLNKIILFDRDNIKYYELVLSIIELYELRIINEYKTNENEYTTMFKLLKTIRLPNEEIENLKKIILLE
jgi:hypothetical protein